MNSEDHDLLEKALLASINSAERYAMAIDRGGHAYVRSSLHLIYAAVLSGHLKNYQNEKRASGPFSEGGCCILRNGKSVPRDELISLLNATTGDEESINHARTIKQLREQLTATEDLLSRVQSQATYWRDKAQSFKRQKPRQLTDAEVEAALLRSAEANGLPVVRLPPGWLAFAREIETAITSQFTNEAVK